MNESSSILAPEVLDAIKDAVKAEGEEPAVAQRLIAWLQATALGESRLSRTGDVERHYEALAAVVQPLSAEEEQ